MTFIVGFPEETEEDFQATMDLVEEVRYGYAYSFKYSTRPWHTGGRNVLRLILKAADDRLQRLQALITRHQREIQDAMVGRNVKVLFEKSGRLPGQMVGKSEYLHSVHVSDADVAAGDLRNVRINGLRRKFPGGRAAVTPHLCAVWKP